MLKQNLDKTKMKNVQQKNWNRLNKTKIRSNEAPKKVMAGIINRPTSKFTTYYNSAEILLFFNQAVRAGNEMP